MHIYDRGVILANTTPPTPVESTDATRWCAKVQILHLLKTPTCQIGLENLEEYPCLLAALRHLFETDVMCMGQYKRHPCALTVDNSLSTAMGRSDW
ncbi:hypothetical protein NDU88_006016 [Pleurodeles waltl]|uniref:Uncharacterized protein n=1 Tax=Pleurodeles waltl TaxID=8319 RepID=A0AAV7NS79_PLEWA|nr:hypothetical protein NDU88_006016 [Pleurodeles waltl]